MLNKLDIATRLALGFGVMLTLIAGLGVFLVYSARSMEAAADDLTRAKGGEILVEQVQNSVLQTRFRMWAYFATGNAENFQKALEGLRIAREKLAKLAAQPSDTASSAQIARTDSAIVAYRKEVSRAFALRLRDKSLDDPELKTRLAEAQSSDTMIERATEHLPNAIPPRSRIDGQKTTKAMADSRPVIMIAGAIGLLSAALAVLIFRAVVRPIEQLKRVMTAIAAGDLNQAWPKTNELDEIGAMAKAMAIRQAELLAQRQKRAAAHLAERIEQEFEADLFRKRSRDCDRSLSGMVETVTQAEIALEGTPSSMTANGHRATTVAAGANSTANLQLVAGAVERLFPSSGQIAGQPHPSRQATRAVFDETDGAPKNIASLSDGSARIGNVVKFINRNAPTTNLLAFNAAIEAAKAEDAGMGFAVAAEEIQRLVNQTEKTAGQIGAQSAVRAMGPVSSGAGEINKFSTKGYEAVEIEPLDTDNVARNVKRPTARGFTDGQLLFASQFLFTCHSLRQETAIMQEKLSKFFDIVREA